MPNRIELSRRSLLTLSACALARASENDNNLFRVTIGKSQIEVTLPTNGLDLAPPSWIQWITIAARAVAAYYGEFPTSNAQVTVHAIQDRAGVLGGTTYGDDPPRTVMRVGQHTTARQLENAWTMTHEFVHLAFPGMPRQHHWLEEGQATYIEPIARSQIGTLTAERVWGDMVRDMHQGQPGPNDRGLDFTHTWGRTYWGGAIFCLLADVQIRERTGNRAGLQQALRGVLAAGGNIEYDWPIEDALKAADAAVRVPVMTELYQQMRDKPYAPDLGSLAAARSRGRARRRAFPRQRLAGGGEEGDHARAITGLRGRAARATLIFSCPCIPRTLRSRQRCIRHFFFGGSPLALTVGIVCESAPGERRVAMTPGGLSVLNKTHAELVLERGAGLPAGIRDAEYAEKGVRIAGRAEVFAASEVMLQVRSLGSNPDAGRADLAFMHRGQTVIGFGEPLTSPEAANALAERGVSFLSMELMPRITRAQSMDALSSMATIAGYKAALIAADSLPRMFPMLMTAAGTVAPARVLVIGAGVAGLQAIATARRLGAVVSGYDIRAAVREQIESLGARFVVLDMGDTSADAETKGGYAKAMGEDFYRRQREAMANVLAEQNVVITTAAVPGKKAPVLITREMVHRMGPGSVIVDIAAERGGNCELTRPGEVVEEDGVSIHGPVNLPSSIPYHASQMYARNIATFLKHLVGRDGSLVIDQADEIVHETLVTHAGEVVHPRVRELMGLPAPVPA